MLSSHITTAQCPTDWRTAADFVTNYVRTKLLDPGMLGFINIQHRENRSKTSDSMGKRSQFGAKLYRCSQWVKATFGCNIMEGLHQMSQRLHELLAIHSSFLCLPFASSSRQASLENVVFSQQIFVPSVFSLTTRHFIYLLLAGLCNTGGQVIIQMVPTPIKHQFQADI